MHTLDEKIEKLKKIVDAKNDFYVHHAEELLEEIASLHNARCISRLMPFFDDGEHYEELMFAIIHTMESFDAMEYVAQVIDYLPEFAKRAPKWCAIVHVRILNSTYFSEAYAESIARVSLSKRELLRMLLVDLMETRPHVKERIAHLFSRS